MRHTLSKNISYFIFISSIIFTANESNAKKIYAKYNPTGARGECVKKVEPTERGKIENVIQYHGTNIIKKADKIHIPGYLEHYTTGDSPGTNLNGTQGTDERHGLAEVLQTMSLIGNGKFNLHKNLIVKYTNHYRRVKYQNGSKKERNVPFSTCGYYKSSESGGEFRRTLIINRSGGQNLKAFYSQGSFSQSNRLKASFGRNNPTHIAHEFAHCVGPTKMEVQGGNGKKKLYEHYTDLTGNRCLPMGRKGYRDNGNEKFAEVFAVYLTNPDLLQGKPECVKSLEFFAQLFGEDVPVDQITCENRKNRLNQYGDFQLDGASGAGETHVQ